MASETVSTDGFEGAFAAIAAGFERGHDEMARRAVKRAGAKTAKALREVSDPKLTGEYAAGWVSSVEEAYGGTSATVHNASKPSLTHLLELGHGGPQPAPAHPHIEPAYREGAESLIKELRNG